MNNAPIAVSRRQRLWCAALLGVVAPGILFGFVLLFGQDSYQYWGDRYHIDLTNKYLYATLPMDSVLGPQWRDETLGGYLWIVSLVTTPLAIDVLAGRLLHLSPLGIELVGTLMLYALAVASMFLYLRRAVTLSPEAAMAGSALFAATAYWDYSLNSNPNIPMAVAWLPALLTMAHILDDRTKQGRGVILPFIGLLLLAFACALHSTVATLPITFLLVGLYAVLVLVSLRTVFWVGAALAGGLLLDAPFFRLFLEAARVSHRNLGTGFYPQAASGFTSWLSHAKGMLTQLALGMNRYGLLLPAALLFVVSLASGLGWRREQPLRRRIILFAAVMWIAIFAIELFHEAINDAKRTVPVLRGWNVLRFADFAFFGLAVVAAWMADRTLFGTSRQALTPARGQALDWGLAAVAGVGGIQIAYAAYRMKDLPAIGAHNLLLYGFLVLYALSMGCLLVAAYKLAQGQTQAQMQTVGLLVAAVSLVTSLHAYRSGLVKPQGIEMSDASARIQTYKQRYELPEEVLTVKRLAGGSGRIVDLTRPLKSETWMLGSEITLYPLAGMRVLSGYSNLYPAWFGLLIHRGVNGKTETLWNILQVEDTGRTNWGVLPLLDVDHVVAKAETRLPGYRAVDEFQSAGKVLYRIEDESRLGPAFVSPGVRCFASDDKALEAIHQATLGELTAGAILVASDLSSVPLCRAAGAGSPEASRPTIRTTRGTDRVAINITNSPGGILTLSDAYYPGWTVLVNGREQPLLRTYIALRGVAIEPGSQSVEFIYAPPTFLLWLKLSLTGVAGLLILAIVAWLRERRRYAASEPTEAASLTGPRGI